MERLVDHGLAPVKRFAKTKRIIDYLNTGDTSNWQEAAPTAEELSEIEAQGFDPVTIQVYLDVLQKRGFDGLRIAAMLRGAFNDLIELIDQPRERAEPAPEEKREEQSHRRASEKSFRRQPRAVVPGPESAEGAQANLAQLDQVGTSSAFIIANVLARSKLADPEGSADISDLWRDPQVIETAIDIIDFLAVSGFRIVRSETC